MPQRFLRLFLPAFLFAPGFAGCFSEEPKLVEPVTPQSRAFVQPGSRDLFRIPNNSERQTPETNGKSDLKNSDSENPDSENSGTNSDVNDTVPPDANTSADTETTGLASETLAVNVVPENPVVEEPGAESVAPVPEPPLPEPSLPEPPLPETSADIANLWEQPVEPAVEPVAESVPDMPLSPESPAAESVTEPAPDMPLPPEPPAAESVTEPAPDMPLPPEPPLPEPSMGTPAIEPVAEAPVEPVAAPTPDVDTENGIVVVEHTEAIATSEETPEEETVTTPGYDPIAENGEYFVDWPKPTVAVVFTGNMDGYVEPCGCAGLARMKGGLSRRHSFFRDLEKRGWPVVAIDAGNLIKGFGLQEEHKFHFVTDEALRLMHYDVTGIGRRELLFPTDSLILYSVDTPGNPKRFTSANVGIYEFDPPTTAPYRIVKRNGLTFGVTSVVCDSQQAEVHNDELVFGDPVQRLRAVLPKMQAENCDYLVLIVHGEGSEAEALNKTFPNVFQFIVTSDTPAEPPRRPILFPDGAYRIEVGEKGKFAVVLGIDKTPGAEVPIRYQRVALDSRYENSPEVLAAMECYQETLEMVGFEGIGIKPVPDPLAAVNGTYVGTKSCVDCHEQAHRVWRKSGHARAWDAIKENSKPSRTHDPECISCHVVGWNPQEMIPFEGGFLGEKETPNLLNVGCEVCHGPGENHGKAEMGSDKDLQEKLRRAVRLPLVDAMKTCIQCHDGDNSPEFDFNTYWPKIEHKESLDDE